MSWLKTKFSELQICFWQYHPYVGEIISLNELFIPIANRCQSISSADKVCTQCSLRGNTLNSWSPSNRLPIPLGVGNWYTFQLTKVGLNGFRLRCDSISTVRGVRDNPLSSLKTYNFNELNAIRYRWIYLVRYDNGETLSYEPNLTNNNCSFFVLTLTTVYNVQCLCWTQ